MLSTLTFQPIFKSVIWGGQRIARFKGLPSQGDHVGESWELSPMAGHESIVESGDYAGETLPELMAEHGREILGDRLYERYGTKFPLLIKFIDSTQDLSIQVHPDDDLARRRHNSLGKTEMWYSVDPAPGAYLYAGFSEPMTPEKFRAKVADSTIVSALCKYYTRPGDVFYLPAGRVHSIGQGNFVVEIQEASDITYRIFDYNRRDASGNLRQLHVEESVDAICYHDEPQSVTNVTVGRGERKMLQACNYFTTELVNVSGHMDLNMADFDSFVILIVTKGHLEVTDSTASTMVLPQGKTALLPASLGQVSLQGDAELVMVRID